MNKAQVIVHLWKANGNHWLILYAFERLMGHGSGFRRKRINLEISHLLPGFNSIVYNQKEWSGYDWSKGGEEWTDSDDWKKSLLDVTLYKYFNPGKRILEIGPGAGRWSLLLAKQAASLTLVDLTEAAIKHCKKVLSGFTNCRFHVNNGANLAFLEDNSVDYIWSYDVFVHIAPADTEAYLRQFSRVLVSGGIAIIHHPASGGLKGGFRSSTTNELFCSFLNKHNFHVIEQLDRWEKNGQYSLEKFDDTVTVFRRG